MMFKGIQIIAILGALALLYITLRLKKKRVFGWADEFVWGAVWVSVLIFAINPELIVTVNNYFIHMGRPLDIFLLIGLLVNFFLLFRIQITLDKNVRAVTELNRDIALREFKATYMDKPETKCDQGE